MVWNICYQVWHEMLEFVCIDMGCQLSLSASSLPKCIPHASCSAFARFLAFFLLIYIFFLSFSLVTSPSLTRLRRQKWGSTFLFGTHINGKVTLLPPVYSIFNNDIQRSKRDTWHDTFPKMLIQRSFGSDLSCKATATTERDIETCISEDSHLILSWF